ncbi:hypothetical protein GCM10007086_24330 [Photobacterium aphoticum]|nr:hypothetical protein GCM10007086_24330 [Photobacterium aphoticum]
MLVDEILDLNTYSPDVEKTLQVELFSVQTENINCTQGKGSLCQYEYFITVSTLDAEPVTNSFDLEVGGEVVDIEWIPTERHHTAMIQLHVLPYTSQALNPEATLSALPQTVLITVTPDQIQENTIN